jgi:hypothetical protein
MAKLTDKQEGFVMSLIQGDSQRQAYIANYNTENMTDKTIDELACRLFANVKVRARYDELKDALVEKAEEEGLLTAIDLLKKLAKLIERNEDIDDRVALDGIKTYGKHHGTFADKIEHSGSIDITTTTKLIDKYLKGD